ncbi:MAG: hypothetical protein ACRC4N_02510 [Gammaproteobacteria bacterium]
MAVTRKDKLASGYNGNLQSVIVYDNAGVNQVKTTNGVVVVLEGLIAGEREVFKARLAGSADAGKELLFIHNAEVMYDERKSKLSDFVIEAGKVARAYHLIAGDVVTNTVDLFSGAVAVGDKLVAKADGKLGVDATALASARTVFEVIENSGRELDLTMDAFAVQVVAN